MNIFHRIGNFFSGAVKASRTAVMNISNGIARWPKRNYENFARETYMKNVIAFRCMDYIAKSIASVPWGVFEHRDDKRERVIGHWFNSILDRPNPGESWSYLMIRYICFLLISGNSYFERLTPDAGPNKDQIKELYILRPDKMTIKLDKETGQTSGYVYQNRITYEIDPITQQCNILHIKLFNPLDDFFGLSITEPTAREIDTSNEAAEWNKKILENEGRPGMVITAKGALTEDQYDRLEKHLKDNYSGSKNAGRSLILESDVDMDAKPYEWSPKEIDFIEGNRDMSRKICNGYGIPPMLIGIPGDATYKNLKEARQAFWEETIFFYLNLAKGEINNWAFTKEDNIFIDYILDSIPALAEKRNMLWERAEKSSFLTINEKREMVGHEKIDDGDVLLVPATMIPLGTSDDNAEDDAKDKEKAKLLEEGYSEDEANKILGINNI